MIVGIEEIAGKTEELSINPLQFLFGKSVKGSAFGGTTRTLHFVNKSAHSLPSFSVEKCNYKLKKPLNFK